MTITTKVSQDISTNGNFSTTEIMKPIDIFIENSNTNKNTSAENKYFTYRKSYISWDKLERANKPDNYTSKTKYLSKNAKALLSVIYQKLKKQSVLLLNHKYISTITNSGSRQNQRIIQEITNIIEISYKRGVTELNGKKYRNCYEFKLKDTSNHNQRIQKKENNDRSSEVFQWTKMSTKNTYSTYIYKNKIINNRSRANFKKVFFDFFSNKQNMVISCNDKINFNNSSRKEQLKNQEPTLEEKITLNRTSLSGFLGSGKYLSEMLDYLTDEMCNILRLNCGRDFTNKAIREIAKAVSKSKKGSKAFFYHIKGFIAYLSKILRYEFRDAVKTSNTNFKIRSNHSEEKHTIQEQEKYLSEIEYSRQVCPEWHLKKKLASVLARGKAYKILKFYKELQLEKGGGTAKLILSKSIELTNNDKEIILSQIQATHEGVDGIKSIRHFEIETPRQVKYRESEHSGYSRIFPDNIWGRIRYGISKTIGVDGISIDKNWFSKLDAKINEESRVITLRAPSKFFAEWIEENYKNVLNLAIKDYGFSLQSISC